jgi:hypothetical protein
MGERIALSIPTQTAMKGLRDAAEIYAAVQCGATFSKSISEVFDI